MTTANTTIAVWCKWIKIIFFSKNYIFLAKKTTHSSVCQRILVISLCAKRRKVENHCPTDAELEQRKIRVVPFRSSRRSPFSQDPFLDPVARMLHGCTYPLTPFHPDRAWRVGEPSLLKSFLKHSFLWRKWELRRLLCALLLLSLYILLWQTLYLCLPFVEH